METLFKVFDGKVCIGTLWARDKRDAKGAAAAQYPQAAALAVKLAQTKRH